MWARWAPEGNRVGALTSSDGDLQRSAGGTGRGENLPKCQAPWGDNHVGARMLVLRCVFSLRAGRAPFLRGGPGCHCGVSHHCSQSFASPLQGELEGPTC